MHRVDAYSMIRRRTAEAGFKIELGCHVFRATGITAYLGRAARSKTRRPRITSAEIDPGCTGAGRSVRGRNEMGK